MLHGPHKFDVTATNPGAHTVQTDCRGELENRLADVLQLTQEVPAWNWPMGQSWQRVFRLSVICPGEHNEQAVALGAKLRELSSGFTLTVSGAQETQAVAAVALE